MLFANFDSLVSGDHLAELIILKTPIATKSKAPIKHNFAKKEI